MAALIHVLPSTATMRPTCFVAAALALLMLVVSCHAGGNGDDPPCILPDLKSGQFVHLRVTIGQSPTVDAAQRICVEVVDEVFIADITAIYFNLAGGPDSLDSIIGQMWRWNSVTFVLSGAPEPLEPGGFETDTSKVGDKATTIRPLGPFDIGIQVRSAVTLCAPSHPIARSPARPLARAITARDEQGSGAGRCSSRLHHSRSSASRHRCLPAGAFSSLAWPLLIGKFCLTPSKLDAAMALPPHCAANMECLLVRLWMAPT